MNAKYLISVNMDTKRFIMNDNYSTPRQNDNNLIPIVMIVIDYSD